MGLGDGRSRSNSLEVPPLLSDLHLPQIISDSIPYHSHTQVLTVMLKIQRGPPRRKDHVKFEDYAYRPDEMWELLERCWAYDPEERPTMDEVVARLKQIAKMREHVKK